MDAKLFYEQLLHDANDRIAGLGSRVTKISWLRIALFAATLCGVYLTWGATADCWIVVGVGVILFVAAAKYHDRLLRLRAVEESKRRLAESRIAVIEGDLSCQPLGEKHIDQMHRFSYDLDLFGRCSLFSMLDSTATPAGADRLASWLKEPLLDADAIEQRQRAIDELSTMASLRIDFHAAGKTIGSDREVGDTDFKKRPSFKLPVLLTVASYIAGPLFVTAVLLAATDFIPGLWVMWLMIGYLTLAGCYSKHIGKLHSWLNSTVENLTAREALFRQIENAPFKSALTAGLQNEFQHNGEKASHLIKRLSRQLKSLDQRYNAAGFLIFNGTMLWDFRVIGNINRWLNRHGDCLDRWYRALGEIDALCALATYAFENPEYVYPCIDREGKTIMKAADLGHPLIGKSRRVCNPLPEMPQKSFIIITGANMAGKSTYLRTIGINYLLALIGAPVAATAMTFSPTKLFTGLRANDSLADGESYFFAELKRLQAVVKEASNGEPMFILLDEILRGTNSADKQRGSLALVKRLITLPVAGALATHDLVLGALAEQYPDNVSSYCFEAEIKGDSLTFDYTLHKGIAHNLNAYFLMEKMGIV